AFEQFARIRRAGRVVGVDQHDCPDFSARARGHQRLDLVRVGQEAVGHLAAVVDRAAVVEDRGRRPQRVVGRGQQDFVAGIEQAAQRQVDQLAHAVADEGPFRRGVGRAAAAMEGGDRLARGRQTLLVGIGIGVGDAVGDRALQVRGRAEAERAGIADVELDQGPALGLELAGPAGQFAADFVSDFGQAFAGLQAGWRHRAAGRRQWPQSLAEKHLPHRSPGKRSAPGKPRGAGTLRPDFGSSEPPGALRLPGLRLESAHGRQLPPRLNPDLAALRVIGWPWEGRPDDPAWCEAMAANPGTRPARVVEQHRSGYIVADGPGEGFAVESPPEWQRPAGYRKGSSSQDQRAAVGDWVLLDGKRIAGLLPRRTAIKRGAAGEHYRQQVIAANVDTVLVVSGLDGDFNPRRIERYLLLVHGGGAQPIIVLTKADRDDSDAQAAIGALAGVAGDVPV